MVPELTEGPYFVDEKLNRSDIRSDPADNTVKAGVPLRLVFNVSQVSSGACTTYAGAFVDIWHCDALGVYSDVQQNNTVGKKFYAATRSRMPTARPNLPPYLSRSGHQGRTVHISLKYAVR